MRQSPELPLAAIGALALGQKIQAIKIVRAEAGLDLKEAKDLVEAYERAYPDIRPISAASPIAGWLWLAVMILMASLAGCWLVQP